ncbi:MAG: DUF1579 family protein [Chloroflexi bacterium]|nr:DUF1579 family protein [Chloroflexota bacterium]
MDVRTAFNTLHGEWAGTNQLWLNPQEAVRTSDTRLRIGPVAMGKFVGLEYTWDEDGPQSGWLLLGLGAEGAGVKAVWVDSWHNADKMMLCEGTVSAEGVVSVAGSYSFGDAPAWGWRIELEAAQDDGFEVRMYNITPEGQEMLAVKAAYTRVR